MRQPIGLAAGESDAFLAALRDPVNCEVVARVETVNREFLGTVQVESGQIDGNADEPIVRRATPTLIDEDGVLDGPSMDKQIAFVYRVRVPRLRTETILTPDLIIPQGIPFTLAGTAETVQVGAWVESPLGVLPIVRPPTRDRDRISVELQDRGAIASRSVAGKTYRKRANVVELIEEILREKCGETSFRFPSGIKDRTEDEVTVGREEELRPWTQCLELAASIDMHLHYDAAGVCVLRKFPDAPVLDISDFVVSPGAAEPVSEVINQVRVLGKRPKDHNWVESLPDPHPLSPKSLRVNGVRQVLEFEEQNTKFNSKAKCKARAQRLMKRYQRALDETQTWNIAPVPHLEAFDPLTVRGRDHDLLTWAFPLGTSGEMTVGYKRAL